MGADEENGARKHYEVRQIVKANEYESPNIQQNKIYLNNNQNINNTIQMNPNMVMLNQMNLPQNQGYMIPPQQPNDYNYQMYNEQYLNNGIYIGSQNPNSGFNNMNFYRNPQRN